MMCKISVIIPVHNAEKYLRECVDSVLNQTYRDLELILVNNNSTDDSLEICLDYEGKDSRVVVVNELRSGAAVARNTGLMNATGQYVTFLDSDDYIRLDTYQHLVSMFQANEYDAICFSYNIVDEKGKSMGWYEPDLKKYVKCDNNFTGIDIARIFLISKDIEGFGWNKIFKKEVISRNDFHFDENKVAFEDMAVFFDLLIKCNSIGISSEKFYYYRQIESSLTHTVYNEKNKDYSEAVASIVETSNKCGLQVEAEVFIVSRYVWSVYTEFKKEKHRLRPLPFPVYKCIYLIWRWLKSEKCRTLVKFFIIFLNNIRLRVFGDKSRIVI